MTFETLTEPMYDETAEPSLQDWVEKCLPSSYFTNSNLAASFMLPIVKTWSSNTTVGSRYSVELGAGAASVAAGRLARRC